MSKRKTIRNTDRIEVVNNPARATVESGISGNEPFSKMHVEVTHTDRTIENNSRITIVENTVTRDTETGDLVNLVVPERYTLQQLVANGNIALPQQVFKGFGYQEIIDTLYTESSPQSLDGDEAVTLTLHTPTVVNQLRGVFSEHSFYHDDRIWPMDAHDTLMIRLTLNIQSIVIDNVADVTLVHSSIIERQRYALTEAVGNAEKLVFVFFLRASDVVMQNGVSFIFNTSSEAFIWDIKAIILPLGSGQ